MTEGGTERKTFNAKKTFSLLNGNRLLLLSALLVASIAMIGYVSATSNQINAQVEEAAAEEIGLGLISSAIAVTGSCIGAGIAIYGAATAGAAAMAERPEISIWVLILAGLGEGVAIYGLLVAIMILGKL